MKASTLKSVKPAAVKTTTVKTAAISNAQDTETQAQPNTETQAQPVAHSKASIVNSIRFPKIKETEKTNFTITNNNVEFTSNKTQTQVSIALSISEEVAHMLNSSAMLTVTKLDPKNSAVLSVTTSPINLAYALVGAANGICEIINTNTYNKSADHVKLQLECAKHGFLYAANYKVYLDEQAKQAEIARRNRPPVWQTLSMQIVDDANPLELTIEQLGQVQAFIDDENGGLDVFLSDLMPIKAFKNAKWEWLAELLSEAGYVVSYA